MDNNTLGGNNNPVMPDAANVTPEVPNAAPEPAQPRFVTQQMPEESMPEQSMPQESMPQQGMPEQSMSQQSMPEQGVPQQGVPQQSMSYQGMPEQGMPYQGMPQQMGGQAQFSAEMFQQMPGYVPQPQGVMPDGKKMKKAKKPKKPWSKGKIAAVAGVGAAAVAGIACAVIFLIVPMFKPAKDVVIDAFENTFDIDGKTTFIDETFGITDIIEKSISQGGHSESEVCLDYIAGYEIDDSITFGYQGSYNPVEKYLNYLLYLGAEDNKYASISLVGTEDSTYLGLPETIADTYIKFPNRDILNAIADSYIGMAANMGDMPQVNIDYFPDLDAAANQSIPIDANVVDAVEELWDNVEVEKDGKESIEIDGETVKTKKYTVSLKEENIEKALSSIIAFAVSQASANSALLQQYGMNVSDLQMISSMVDSYVPMLISGDFVIDVYIADDKVVRIAAADDISSAYMVGSMSYDFCFDIYDGNMELNIKLSQGGESVNFVVDINDYETAPSGEIAVINAGIRQAIKFNTDIQEDDTKRHVEITVTDERNGAAASKSVVIQKNYIKADQSFDGTLYVMDGGNEVVRVFWEGKVPNSVKGELIEVDISSIRFEEDGETLFTGSARFALDTTKIDPAMDMSSCNVIDIANLDLAGMQNLLIDNQDEIMQWIDEMNNSPLGQLYNLISSTNQDYITEEPTEPETPDPGVTAEDMILCDEDGNQVVTILTEFENLELTYANGEYIDYENQDGTVVEYELICEDTAPREFLEEQYDGDIVEVKIDDFDVVYVIWEEDNGEVQFRAVTAIEEGKLLTLSAIITDEAFITPEELLNTGYSSQNVVPVR